MPRASRLDRLTAVRAVPVCVAVLAATMGCPSGGQPSLRFEITFPDALRDQPVTGRVYVIATDSPDDPARRQRALGHQPVGADKGAPFFAVDVDRVAPGETMVLGADAIGYPFATPRDLPAGDYFVQALLNIYTEFRRADGHVVWAHMDEWEGQHFNWAPGNLISGVQPAHLNAEAGYTVALELSEALPPIEPPPDTDWIKRVRIRSDLLSDFWGHPIYLGATLLLPKGYEDHPDVRYPAVYLQGHFSLAPPFGFSTEPVVESEARRRAREERGLETGYELYQSWIGDDFPRLVAVTFQHPTPYFDDSYAVNSANNGPFADALLTELIPHLEKNFRLVPEGYARVLTGGSTGGYEALALQVHHPRFFGGTWVFYPDPIDFRSLFLINIYEDGNAFTVPGYGGLAPERYAVRAPNGQPLQSVRDLSQLARALGSRGRSTEYLEAWEAAFGPVGNDGYPRPLLDKATGAIDREVALYWRDNGYDLGHYLRHNWSEIGPDLVGKIHVYVGDMDDYYFNIPVYLLEEFLESTTDPYYSGSVSYGRPLKGHGWHPKNNAGFLREMVEQIERTAPPGAETSSWRYR